MILISSRKLENKIPKNELTDWEKTKYLIFMFIFSGTAAFFSLLKPNFGPEPPRWDTIITLSSCIASVLISYFGIKKCYLINKEVDNAHFIERFVILSVPMITKFLLFNVSAFILYIIIWAYLFGKEQPSKDLTYYLFSGIGIIIGIAFYVFLTRSFHRLALLMEKNMEP